MTAETQADQRTNTALTDRLRGEIAASQDRGLHALLLHEVGVLHEAGGEEPLAARDYLAAYNADADFREPLESLVRILSRRRSFKNLASARVRCASWRSSR
jgi:cellulose synthase operon protein C